MKEMLINSNQLCKVANNLGIHFTKWSTNTEQKAPVSTGSTTSFCSCVNGIKSTNSLKNDETRNVATVSNISKIPRLKEYESRGCQTNLDKEVTVELAVFHGEKKVVSEIFEFPNSVVNDETVVSKKSFEIYYEILNDEMLQIWGVENTSDPKDDGRLDPVHIRPIINNVDSEEVPNFKSCHDEEREKLHALVYRTKEQAARCKSIILEKYDELWNMLNKTTIEALNEIVAKEKELVDLIEQVSEIGISTTDYDSILSSINFM